MTICYILYSLGTYIFSSFGIMYQEKSGREWQRVRLRESACVRKRVRARESAKWLQKKATVKVKRSGFVLLKKNLKFKVI
jgi:hypothetical protein